VLILYFIVGNTSLAVIRWYERRLRVDVPKSEELSLLRPIVERR
jgi:hypothetical protein